MSCCCVLSFLSWSLRGVPRPTDYADNLSRHVSSKGITLAGSLQRSRTVIGVYRLVHGKRYDMSCSSVLLNIKTVFSELFCMASCLMVSMLSILLHPLSLPIRYLFNKSWNRKLQHSLQNFWNTEEIYVLLKLSPIGDGKGYEYTIYASESWWCFLATTWYI